MPYDDTITYYVRTYYMERKFVGRQAHFEGSDGDPFALELLL